MLESLYGSNFRRHNSDPSCTIPSNVSRLIETHPKLEFGIV
jgi:hypothetical protein